MHNKTKTSTEPPQPMGIAQIANNRSTTLTHHSRTIVTGFTSAFIIFMLTRKQKYSVSNHNSVGASMVSWITHLTCNKLAATCDSQKCGILTSVDSDEPVQTLFKLRNSNGVRTVT